MKKCEIGGGTGSYSSDILKRTGLDGTATRTFFFVFTGATTLFESWSPPWFRSSIFFRGAVVSPTPNTQSGGPGTTLYLVPSLCPGAIGERKLPLHNKIVVLEEAPQTYSPQFQTNFAYSGHTWNVTIINPMCLLYAMDNTIYKLMNIVQKAFKRCFQEIFRCQIQRNDWTAHDVTGRHPQAIPDWYNFPNNNDSKTMGQEEFPQMLFLMSAEQLMWCNLPEIKLYVVAPDDVHGLLLFQIISVVLFYLTCLRH
jgi:hypothetical protein